MTNLFTVPVRTVTYLETILADDHNNKVDAIKELINVAKNTLEEMLRQLF